MNDSLFMKLFKRWAEENNKQIKIGHYLDGEFFQWLVSDHKSTGLYQKELYEAVDLLIRKNMTHKQFIGYEQDEKSEMYSSAMMMVFQYTIKDFDASKASAFTWFTTAIRNAFKGALKTHYRAKNVAAKIMHGENVDNFIHNYDSKEASYFTQDLRDAMEHVSKEEIKQMTQKTKDFYDEISKSFTSTKIRLLDDENAPKFKRQYSEYPCFIPVHNFNQTSLNYDLYTNVNRVDFVEMASQAGIKLDVSRDIKELKKTFLAELIKPAKGIVVDFFDLSLINESCGIRKSYIQHRAVQVRNLGHQYLGVFSDEWEIGKEVVMKRLQKMYDLMLNQYPISSGRYIRYDYIVQSDLRPDNMYDIVWYGLKDKREVREIAPIQTVDAYMKWLDSEKNATRVYDASILKSI